MVVPSEGKEYDAIFRYSAVPLWVEDISRLRARLELLRSSGVSDIASYLARHGEFVRTAVDLIEVVDVNDAVLRLYNVSSKERLIGSLAKTLDLHDEKTLSSIMQDIIAIFEGQTYLTKESRAVKPTGERIDILIYSYFPPTVQMSSYMLVSVIDVTEQRRAERRLRQSEERFRAVVEASVHPIVNIDSAGRIISWNEAAHRLLGYSVSEVLGSAAAAVLPDAMIPGGPASARTTDAGGAQPVSVQPTEAVLAAKDGRRIAVEFTIADWNTENETCHTVLIRDITERKAASEKLKEQAKLLDIASDAIIVIDIERKIRYWNKSAERMFGWTAEEALGRTQNELFCSSENPGELTEAQGAAFATGQWSGESHYSTKDGRILIGETRLTLVADDNGNPTGILSVTTDTTERRALEQELLRYQRLDSIGTLAGGIAHDLNNVLTPIVGGIESLALGMPDGDGKRLLEIIKGSALRGASIIRQLLDFARGMEAGKSTINVAGLVREVASIIDETFPKSIRFESAAVSDIYPILGEGTQIHQVLMNLCVNARDAMPDGGELLLAARNEQIDEAFARTHVEAKPGPYVVLRVADTGKGMAQSVVERAFDPFFTTKETGKGTGLGLSTSLSIVRSHGGFVTVASEPGRGTAFEVYLPALMSAPPLEANEMSAQGVAGEGGLVLVADDEEAVRHTTRRILENRGFSVVTTSDGAELVAQFERLGGEVRLVLTDMVMPNLDGASAIRAIRAIDSKVPIVVMSGLSGYRDDLAELDGCLLLPKPFSIASLFEAIGNALVDETPGH